MILPFPFEDDVQFLVGFVGVQEAAVLAGSQRLEGEFAPGGADGLGADFRFSVDGIVVPGRKVQVPVEHLEGRQDKRDVAGRNPI